MTAILEALAPITCTAPRLARGADAFRALSTPDLETKWNWLHQRCPWATTCQSFGFVSSWYTVYAHRYEPVIIWADCDSGMAGALPLALERSSSRLVIAGDHQMDYQAWLALPETNDQFITDTLRLVHQQIPNHCVVFRYLPPGTPVEWASNANWSRHCHFELSLRPVMRVIGTDKLDASLQKKSNKKRLNRLSRVGEVRLEHINDHARAEALLEEIIPMYDLRQGARSGRPPFQTDRSKKQFYLTKLRSPDLLHVTVLKAGTELLAANIGPQEKDMVGLGVFAFSPFHAEHSPGSMYVYLLGERLRDEGVSGIDLTPDGAYKDRFATEHEQVHLLTVYSSARHALWAEFARRMRAWIKSHMVRVANRFQPGPWKKRLSQLFRRPASRWMLYTWRPSKKEQPVQHVRLEQDRLEDLLTFRVDGPSKDRQEFFSACLRRLEKGWHAFTYAPNGRLQDCAWMMEPSETVYLPELHQKLSLEPGTTLLFDVRLNLSGGDATLSELLYRAAAAAPANTVCICTLSQNWALRRALERTGAILARTITVSQEPAPNN